MLPYSYRSHCRPEPCHRGLRNTTQSTLEMMVNTIFKDGIPRHNICMGCLASVKFYNPHLRLGRGVSSHVELGRYVAANPAPS